jgi:ABC-type transport system involved in multi-copper enzyme maturation permease subunit
VNRVVVMETLRRHAVSPGYVIYVVLTAIVAAGSAMSASNSQSWQGMTTLLILILASQLIGPEFSSGTLQLVIAKPVNRSAYLLSRVAGVVAAGWVALWVPFAIYVIVRLLARGVLDWRGLFAPAVHRTAGMLLIGALLALFGSFTRAYFNIAIYVALSIGLSAFLGFLGLLGSGREMFGAIGRLVAENPWIAAGVRAVDTNLFPDPPGGSFDRLWLAMVLSNALVALSAACVLFNRREVPYGAD